MITSSDIGEISAALAKAQGEITPAAKTAENAAFKNGGKVSKYADLTAVWDACRPVLVKNDLAVLQDVTLTDVGVGVSTRITHKSGQWIEFGPVVIPLSKRDAHGVGSATTYARRYGLAAAIGVVADDDDDGNEAVKPGPANTQQNQPEKRGKMHPTEPGISKFNPLVHDAVRDLMACADEDQLSGMLTNREFKELAIRSCRDFPSTWTGPEDSGLRNAIIMAAKNCQCEARAIPYVVNIENKAKEPIQKAAAE